MTAHQPKEVRTQQRRKEKLLSLFRKVSKTKDTEFICLRTITSISTNLSTINNKLACVADENTGV